METLIIHSGQGNYQVDFFPDLQRLFIALEHAPLSVAVIDRKVAGLYTKELEPVFARLPVLLLDATEEEKTLLGVEEVLAFLQDHDATRQSVVLAIGGGIIQDIVAFAAKIYYRGLKWIFVPTTLLAMSDSCIGAKCNVNFRSFKNQIGAFHSPVRILICARFIHTLSGNDIQSGYGEIFKLMLTGSQSMFNDFVAALEQGELSNNELQQFIEHSLKVKQKVIEVDEYEQDVRRILNYGHTFGHALEALSHYEIPHGCAVAWGVDLANYISWKMGLLSAQDFEKIHLEIETHFHFHLSQAIDPYALIRTARRDKKAAQGKINLVLLRSPGQLEIVPIPFDDQLERWILNYLENYKVVDWN